MTDIRALSYIIATHPDLAAWQRFGERVLGTQSCRSPNGDLWLKMDERACRFVIQQAPESRYFACGWEVASAEEFNNVRRQLEKSGVRVGAATEAERDSRGCIDMLWFFDPSGNRHEVVLGFKSDFQRLVSPTGTSFVTGALGMGHVALPATNFDATADFLREVLGFGLSDYMVHRPLGAAAARIMFLHCNNGRHHSLAIAELPAQSGCVHLMVEVPDMDEVGRAMDRRAQHEAKLLATLGRHVNDRMTSFYIQSPSGFALEYGYGGKVCDWSRNVVHETTAVSLWGHDFSIGFG